MKGSLASLRRERRGRGNREEEVKVSGGGEWEGGLQKKIKTIVKLKLINNLMVTIIL